MSEFDDLEVEIAPLNYDGHNTKVRVRIHAPLQNIQQNGAHSDGLPNGGIKTIELPIELITEGTGNSMIEFDLDNKVDLVDENDPMGNFLRFHILDDQVPKKRRGLSRVIFANDSAGGGAM